MKKYTILCVDDEREVLDSIYRDLEPLSSHFDIEAAESAEEARILIEELATENRELALIFCDHIMPGVQGVEFLIELNKKEETKKVKKVLLTGQAGLEATIEAVNHGGLDYYVAKPWTLAGLMQVAKDQLTSYIIENELEKIPYAEILDSARIFEAIYKNG